MRKTAIIIAILSILWSILLTGCSRKVLNTKTSEKTQTETAIKETATETVKDNTNTKTIAESDELEVTPIDNTKPLTINGKTYFNARIKATKSKSNTTTANDITTAKKAVKEVEKKEETVKEVKDKKTEKQDYSILVIIGAIVTVIIVYMHIKFK